MTEPCEAATHAALRAPGALLSLAFLAAASVIGGTLYPLLLARWEAGRVASYAYICPLIALAEAALIGGRLPDTIEFAAVLMLLVATRCGLTVAPSE